MLRLLKALGYLVEALVYLGLLICQVLYILTHLVKTDLQSIILSILIVHGQQQLIVLLEVILPFLVLKLILSYLDAVLPLLSLLLLASYHIPALDHPARVVSQDLPGEEPSEQDERPQLGLLEVKGVGQRNHK